MTKTLSIAVFAAALICTVAPWEASAAVVPVPDEQTWIDAVGGRSQVDFEAFTGPLDSQYPGIVFSPFNDGMPTSTIVYPRNGQNCMFTAEGIGGGGGGWAADFDVPTRGIAVWVGDLQFEGTTISLYDAAHVLLDTFDLLLTGNGNGPAVYGFNAYVSDAADIARIEIAIDASDAVWFDDLQFEATTASAPALGGRVVVGSWGRTKELFR